MSKLSAQYTRLPMAVRRYVRVIILLLIDMVCIGIALYITSNIRFDWNSPSIRTQRVRRHLL